MRAVADRDVPRSIDTVVIGAGHAGLMMSWHLQRAGRDHVVLERRDTLGGGWQDRWDDFRLVSPSWMSAFPGYPYEGDEPDGYLPRDAIVERVARYAEVFDAPVTPSTEVTRLGTGGPRRFRLETTRGPIDADAVIMATGAFHRPKIPAGAAGFASRIVQIHAHDYRRPAALPTGGVLVVGSGQTGCQLAEELSEAGREVWLAIGRCGRNPRRYRGRDIFWWARQLAEHGEAVGTPLPRVDQLPTRGARFACNAHLSGHGGGHDTNLRRMARDGIHLTGRFLGADGERATFAADLADNLTFADTYFDRTFRDDCDAYAAATGIEVGEDDREWPAFDPPEIESLDLARAGISTILWTTGYRPDYDWLDLPILDEFGVPRHVRGVTEVPGLTMVGALWQHNPGSANLIGVHLDAAYLAERW
jgi:putative flavoprotein involved in K+ transport